MTDLKDKKIPNHLKSLWRPHPDLNGDRRFRKPYFYFTQNLFKPLMVIFDLSHFFNSDSSVFIQFNRIFREKLGKTYFSFNPVSSSENRFLTLSLSHFSIIQNKINQYVYSIGGSVGANQY